jgi:Calx-beta domain
MQVWLRPRYFCTNVAGGCRFAKADTPFSAADFTRYQGLCRGADGQGCGQPLTSGEPLDLRARWSALALTGVLLLGGSGWLVRSLLFPPPLQHVAFAVATSEAADTDGRVSIEVVRDADINLAVSVDYAATDGTAKLGQDYSAAPGRLAFAPGERRKTLAVTLLPDASFQKPRRHFTLALVNVQGEPNHVVNIVPRQVDLSANLLAEQSVRSASLVAKDVADLVVRLRVLDQLLSASRDKAGEFREYKQSMDTVNGNFSRARERYLQVLRDLQQQQPGSVLGAMERVGDEFKTKGFLQQSKAVAVMAKHYRELLNHRDPDMDRWAQELSDVVPRVDGTDKASPTT